MNRGHDKGERRVIARRLAGLPAAVGVVYVLMFAVAFVVYTAVWTEAPVLDGDSAQYLEVAQDLADGRLDRLHLRSPGYPLLLALSGSTEEPVRRLLHVALVLHFAGVWALGAALHRTGAGPSWLLATGCLLLLPHYVEPAAYVMTESLAQSVLAVGCACLVLWRATGRASWIIAAAIVLSFSAVVRPVNQLLVPVLALVIFVYAMSSRAAATGMRARYVGAAAALVGGWVLIVGGTALFNYVRFESFVFSPAGGYHFSTKMMPYIERLPDEYAAVREILIRERDAQLVKRGGAHTGTQAVWSVRDELEQVTGLSQPELSNYLVRMNLALIRRAPMEYLQEVARSFAVYWFPVSGRLASMDSGLLRGLWISVHSAVVLLFGLELLVLTALAIVFITMRRAGSSLSWTFRIQASEMQAFAFAVAGMIVLYTAAMCCAIDIGEPRQRRSTDAIIVFACVLGALIWSRTAAAQNTDEVEPFNSYR